MSFLKMYFFPHFKRMKKSYKGQGSRIYINNILVTRAMVPFLRIMSEPCSVITTQPHTMF